MRLRTVFIVLALIAGCAAASGQGGWVSILSPAPGDVLSGRSAEISVGYNTGSSDRATRVELAIDGRDYGAKYLSEPATRGVASFLIDTSRLGNGGHSLLVKVFSGDKLIGSASGECTIGNRPIDVLPPEINFVGIRTGAIVSGTTGIKVFARDDSGADPLVSVFIDKSLKMIKNTPPYEYAWNTGENEDGRHVLSAYGYDGAGNKGEAQAVEVTVQNNRSTEVASAAATSEKTRTAAQPAASTARTTVPTAGPGKTGTPIIPVERPAKESAARSVAEQPRVAAPAAKPTAPVEQKLRPIPVRPVEKPGAAAQAAAREIVPAVPDKPSPAKAAARSAVPQTAVTAPKGTPPAVSGKPLVVAIAQDLAVPSIPSLEMPKAPRTNGAGVGQPAAPPTVTLPSRVRSETAPAIMAAVPEERAAAPVPSIPSVSEPIATRVAKHSIVSEQKTQSVEVSCASLAQKLARPAAPQPEPIKMALAPKPKLVALPTSLEHSGTAVVKLPTKTLGRAIVTELRRAISAAGGGISSWHHRTRTVLAAFGGKRIRIRISDPVAIVGDQIVRLPTAPYINTRGRTMVDVRLLKAILGPRFEVDARNRECRLIPAN